MSINALAMFSCGILGAGTGGRRGREGGVPKTRAGRQDFRDLAHVHHSRSANIHSTRPPKPLACLPPLSCLAPFGTSATTIANTNHHQPDPIPSHPNPPLPLHPSPPTAINEPFVHSAQWHLVGAMGRGQGGRGARGQGGVAGGVGGVAPATGLRCACTQHGMFVSYTSILSWMRASTSVDVALGVLLLRSLHPSAVSPLSRLCLL